jgi:cytochrome P450
MDESLSDWTVFLDGDEHLRLRHWLNKAFTPAAIAGLTPKIDEAVAHLLKDVEDHDTFDLLRSVAGPLPAMVIGMILGVPSKDIHLIKQWSEGLSAFFSGKAPLAGPEAYAVMTEYVGHIVRARRAEPQDDLISAMIHAEPSGRPLTDRELLANCVMLLFAGHETTTRLMVNGMIAVLQRPSQLELMRSSQVMLVGGIEEFLRFEPAFLLVSRIVDHDLEMHGATIPADSRIGLVIAAANRDPRQFENPDEFDASRHPNPHLAFGAGPHFCLGAPLARTETRLLYQALFQHFKEITLAEEVEWTGSAVFRVPKKLDIRVFRS